MKVKPKLDVNGVAF